MGGPARPLHEPGNHRSSERCSHRHSADRGSLIGQPTLLRITAPTPRPGARSSPVRGGPSPYFSNACFDGQRKGYSRLLANRNHRTPPLPAIGSGPAAAGHTWQAEGARTAAGLDNQGTMIIDLTEDEYAELVRLARDAIDGEG